MRILSFDSFCLNKCDFFQKVPTLSSDINSFLGSLHRMHEEVEYEEPQESYEEEDGRSNVTDLITVDESSNADAFSLAYIQVSLSLF